MSAFLARMKARAVRELKRVVKHSALAQAVMAFCARVALSVANRVSNAVAVRSYGFFDATFYSSQIPHSPLDVQDAVSHYLAVGAERGLDPHPLFHSKYYLDRNPDVAGAGGNPLVHYLLFGALRGLTPHPAFDESPVVVQNLLNRYPSFRQVFCDRYPLPQKWYDGENPEVSIIVLSYFNSPLTVHCLDCIWRFTEGARYEVIVLDNGSSFRDIAAVTSYLFAGRLIALQVNRGFGEGNNIASDIAKGEYLFFLNNDAAVTGNWLEPLVQVMRSHPDAGAVGAKLHYPSGVLQEAGALVLETGDTVQIGKGDAASKPNYNVIKPVDYCSASALLVDKSLFTRSLGFDHRFDPAYYEDADLCFKLREQGAKVYFCPESVVIHQEAAAGRDPSADVRLHNVVETNKAKFLQKWHPLLSRDSFRTARREEPRAADVGIPHAGVRRFGARADSADRPRIALYSPFAFVPGGGERYLLSIAELLNEDEFVVDFVTPHKYSTLRVAAVTGELGLDIAALGLRTLSEIKRGRPYDVFVSIGNQVVPPVRGCGVRNFYICQFPFPTLPEYVRERRAWYDEYDKVLVYSRFVANSFEAAARRAALAPMPVEVVQPPVAMCAESIPEKKRMILTVGRFFVGGHNKKQLEMVRIFRRMCDEGLRGWELHLAGGVHPEYEHREYFLSVKDLAAGYPVDVHPNPSRGELNALYRDASIYWHAAGLDEDIATHPERFEHFGITTVEAMSAGAVPIVIGEGGQREIVEDGSSGFLWNSLDELMDKTHSAIGLHERGGLRSYREEAIRRASAFDGNRFRERMAQTLEIDRLRGTDHRALPIVNVKFRREVDFQCNLCDGFSSVGPEAIHREIPSCTTCRSTVRFRALVHVLSMELFGESIPLKEFPRRKDIRGLGMSDWEPLSERLEQLFDHTNTYFHREPRLDICNIEDSMEGQYDYLLSSDVLEHVAPPVSRAFDNAFRLLKPNGFFLLTVPFRSGQDTVEHFPELYDYRLVQVDGRQRLVNRTRDGVEQVFDDLEFHGGEGSTLEMRIFGETALREHLKNAGFGTVISYGDDYGKYGIYWPDGDNTPLVARKAVTDRTGEAVDTDAGLVGRVMERFLTPNHSADRR